MNLWQLLRSSQWIKSLQIQYGVLEAMGHRIHQLGSLTKYAPAGRIGLTTELLDSLPH